MRRFKRQRPGEEALAISRRLVRRFDPDEAAIEKEVRLFGSRALVFTLVPEEHHRHRVHEA